MHVFDVELNCCFFLYKNSLKKNLYAKNSRLNE